MDYIGAGFLALVLIFLWQLYRGPIAVPFLKPYIIKALNHDDAAYQVTLDSVNIELVRSIQPIKIIANNVTYRKNDETFVINAPKTSVSFSIRALLHGVIAPSSIEVNNPTIYMFMTYGVGGTGKENNINRKKLEYYFDSFEKFIERFNSEDHSYTESYINEIVVNNAEVEYHEVELGRKWILSDLNYYFERNFSNIETGFNSSFKLTDKSSTTIGLDAKYNPLNNKLHLKTYFADLIPMDLLNNVFEERYHKQIYAIDLPVNGTISAQIDFSEILKNKNDVYKSIDTAFDNIQLSLEGGSGNVRFSDNEEYNYAISSFMLNGKLGADLDKLSIADADFDLGAQKAKLSFDISGLKKFFFEDSPEDIKIKFKAHIDKLDFDELYKYWPRYVAEKAWLWCKESIYGGDAANADFLFEFGYNKNTNNIVFQNLTGTAEVVDSNLNYLKGMPHIKNIYGQVHFSPNDLKIGIEKGVSDGVVMTGGEVWLKDLDKDNNFASIKIEADSSITDALKLIDNPPLGYATEMGLQPDAFEGDAVTNLSLDFELKSNLSPSEVKVNVDSVLQNVNIPNLIKDKNISAKELNLKVNNGGMLIDGQAIFDELPVQLTWDESFGNKNYKSKYKLSFKYDDAFKNKFGLDKYKILNAPYISGTADVIADIISYDNDKYEISINADVSDTDIDFSFFGFN